MAPVRIGLMPLRRAVNTDIDFSIGNRTKGSLREISQVKEYILGEEHTVRQRH